MKRNKKNKAITAMTAMSTALLMSLWVSGCGKTEAGSVQTDSPAMETSQKSRTDGGTEKELEPVDLTWILRIPEQPDGSKVLDALNGKLQEAINATLKVQFIDPVAYPEKTKLKISSGEKFDMMFTSAGYGFYDYASKGAYLPLDDLLAEYAPKTCEMIPESFWEAVKVNGHIYGIPNYQIAARQSSLIINKDLIDKYVIDTDKIKTLEDMEPVLALLKEKEPDKRFLFGPDKITNFDTMHDIGLEGIGADGTPGCIEIAGTELKVINQFEHASFIQLVNTLKKFEEAGYINKDLALVEDATELFKNGEIPCSMGNYKPGIEAEELARFGFEREYIKITEPYVNTTSILGTLQAISRTSENPERALMFLDLVNSDPEVYNTLVYGLEDQHYKMLGDNKIELIEDSGYTTNAPWMIGNTFNGYLKPGTDADIYKQTQELNENSEVSRIMGFSFNPEPVKAEISQCATIIEKYISGFRYGLYDDVSATLESFNDDLRAAGMDKIIAEKQVQLDTWAAIQ